MRFARWRRDDSQVIFLVAEMVLIFAGTRLASIPVWRGVTLVIAVIAIFGWLSAQRRARAILDTPTSRIASAAQGYVELQGSGGPLGGLPVISTLTHTQCLWYRYRIEVRNDNKWRTTESGNSDASFLLNDSSGVAVVDPDGAEILPDRCTTWIEGSKRYTEWLIIDHDPVYVLGGFVTRGGDQLDLSLDQDVSTLLAEWKLNRPTLLKRFDLDANGEIDLREWELVRAQARRDVEKEHTELRTLPGTHLVGAPSGGRPYLISTLPTEKMVARFRRWIGFHLLVFGGALVGFAKSVGLF